MPFLGNWAKEMYLRYCGRKWRCPVGYNEGIFKTETMSIAAVAPISCIAGNILSGAVQAFDPVRVELNLSS